MEELIIKYGKEISKSQTMIYELRSSLSGENVTITLKKAFDKYENSIAKYRSDIENSSDSDEVLQSILMVFVYSQAIAQQLNKTVNLNEHLKSQGSEILSLALKMREEIESRTVVLDENDASPDKGLKSISLNRVNSELKALKGDKEIHDARIKKLLSENESRISLLNESTKNLKSDIKDALDKVTDLYNDSLKTIKDKQEQIDDILSHSTGKAIAGDFEKVQLTKEIWPIGYVMDH